MSNARKVKAKRLRARCARFQSHRLELITDPGTGTQRLTCTECHGPVRIRQR